MSDMLRSQIAAGSYCNCCNDPYRDNPRAYEKRLVEKEIAEELHEQEEIK